MSAPEENVKQPVILTAEQDRRLIEYGYEPICVDPQSKKPAATGWREGAITPERIAAERADFPNSSTGLRCGTLTTPDIDVANEDHWRAVADLAFDVLGDTPLGRRGSKGILLAYRNASPIGKISIKHRVEGKFLPLVEILGSGQQFIAYGIHPKTGKPYEWIGSDPDFGIEDPLTVPLASLPETTPETLRHFARKAAVLLTELGYQDVKISGDMGEDRKASVSNGAPVAEKVLRDALSYLDPGCGREDYWRIVAGIHAANIAGDDAGTIRRNLACGWARGDLDRLGRYKNSPPANYQGDDDVLKDFDTSEPRERGVTVGTVFDMATKAGWQGNPHSTGKTAAEIFKDVKLPAHNSPATAPDEVSLVPFSEIEEERMEWLWHGRFAIGKLSLIAGTPGDGKTTIALDLAARQSNGADLPFNEGKLEQSAAVILSAEDDPSDTLKPRLRAAGADMEYVFHLASEVKRATDDGVQTGMFNFVDDMRRVEAKIVALRKQGYVVKSFIIDPITAFMGGRIKGDSWKNADVRYILTFLTDFARRQKVAVIGITHLNKSADTRAIYRVLDSIGMVGAARGVWITAKEVDDNGDPSGRTLFALGKTNIAKPPATLAYKIEGVLLKAADGGAPIETSRIKWEAISALTADQALSRAGKGNSEENKTSKAMAFLEQVLADGRVDYQEVRRKARKQKQAWRTVERAKSTLGIKTEREGFGKDSKSFWCLPDGASGEADDPDAALLYGGGTVT